MATKAHRPTTSISEEMERVFGQGAPMAQRVLDLIESEPNREWRIYEIIDELDLGVVDVLVIAGRLTYAGLVRHEGLGAGYSACSSSIASRAG